MEYEYLLENISREDMSMEEVISSIGEGEAVVAMTSRGCSRGRGAFRAICERYSLKERLLMAKANWLPAGQCAVFGCYDEIFKKTVAVFVVVTRDAFWKEEDVFLFDGLATLARVANSYNFMKLFLLCDDSKQAKLAYDLSLEIFKKEKKKIKMVIVNNF